MPLNMEPDKFGNGTQDFQRHLFEEEPENDPMWELLSIYADGEATDAEAEKIEALLKSDPLLAQELRFFQSTHQIIVTIQEVEPPANLRMQILAATTQRLTLRKRVANLRRSLRLPALPALNRYALPMGAITVTAMATFIILNRQEEQRLQSPIPVPTKGEEIASAYRNPVSELPSPLPNKPTSGQNPIKLNPAPVKPNPTLRDPRPTMVAQGTSSVRSVGFRSAPTSIQRHPLPTPKGIDVAQKPTSERGNGGSSDPEKTQEPMVIMTDFAPQPMMEADNQRPVVQMVKATTELPEVRNHDAEPTDATASQSVISASERLKARLRQSRQMILADLGRNHRTPSDGVFRGATIQDANVRLVDNLKRSQSSALFVKQF